MASRMAALTDHVKNMQKYRRTREKHAKNNAERVKNMQKQTLTLMFSWSRARTTKLVGNGSHDDLSTYKLVFFFITHPRESSLLNRGPPIKFPVPYCHDVRWLSAMASIGSHNAERGFRLSASCTHTEID